MRLCPKKRKTNKWNVKFVITQAFLAVPARVSMCILAVALDWTHSMHIALHAQCNSCGAVPCRAQIWDCCVFWTVFMLWSLIFKNAMWVANLEIARVSKVFWTVLSTPCYLYCTLTGSDALNVDGSEVGISISSEKALRCLCPAVATFNQDSISLV